MSRHLGDADDRIAGDVAVRDVVDCLVLQDLEGCPDLGDVLGRGIDQEIDVLRRPAADVGDDREAADEDILGAVGVQRPADLGEIVELRFT